MLRFIVCCCCTDGILHEKGENVHRCVQSDLCSFCAHGIHKKDENMLGWVLKAVTWSLSVCAVVVQMGYARKTRTCWAGC